MDLNGVFDKMYNIEMNTLGGILIGWVVMAGIVSYLVTIYYDKVECQRQREEHQRQIDMVMKLIEPFNRTRKKELYNKVNDKQYAKLTHTWYEQMRDISVTMDPNTIYKHCSNKLTKKLCQECELLWTFYNDPCANLLDSDYRDAEYVVFGEDGCYVPFYNGLLGARLAIVAKQTHFKNNDVMCQLVNYWLMCNRLKELAKDKESIGRIFLPKLMSVGQLYKLYENATVGEHMIITEFEQKLCT